MVEISIPGLVNNFSSSSPPCECQHSVASVEKSLNSLLDNVSTSIEKRLNSDYNTLKSKIVLLREENLSQRKAIEFLQVLL